MACYWNYNILFMYFNRIEQTPDISFVIGEACPLIDSACIVGYIHYVMCDCMIASRLEAV